MRTSLHQLAWTVLAWLMVTGRGRAADATLDFPRELAFNSGSYNADTVTDAVNKGLAEVVRDPLIPDDIIVRHFWIEVYEGDYRTTDRVVTAFEICESRFSPALIDPNAPFQDRRPLNGLVIRYVLLDYAGGHVGSPMKETYRPTQDPRTWLRTEARDGDFYSFQASLSPLALKQLRMTSGFASSFPGQNVVAYTSDLLLNVLVKLTGLALAAVLAPATLPEDVAAEVGIFGNVLDFLKSKAADITLKLEREWLAKKKVHWGRDSTPSDGRLKDVDTAALVLQAGTVIWPVLPTDLDGVWESTDADKRFRLEISGLSVRWVERSRAPDTRGREIAHYVLMTPVGDGSHRIERPYDPTLLQFSFPTQWEEVQSGNPTPSFLVLRVNGDNLKGPYRGVRINGDGDMLQPGDQGNPSTDFTFKLVSWQPDN